MKRPHATSEHQWELPNVLGRGTSTTAQLALAVVNIQRLSLDNHQLRQQLDSAANVTRINTGHRPVARRLGPDGERASQTMPSTHPLHHAHRLLAAGSVVGAGS